MIFSITREEIQLPVKIGDKNLNLTQPIGYVVSNLDATKNWEPWEESKGAAKNRYLSLEGGFLVLRDLVEQGRVEVDLDQDQSRVSIVLH